METKQNNQRSNAMRWWSNLDVFKRGDLCKSFHSHSNWHYLGEGQIEDIYNSQKKVSPMYNEARECHYNDYKSANFPFLNDSEDSIDTYALGYSRGIKDTTDRFEKTIKLLEDKINSLQNTTV